MFAVLAAGAALYSFYEAGKVLDRISQNHTPEAILSLELSRQAERVVSAASAMLTVNSTLQREQVRAKVAVEGERLQALVTQLRDVGQDESLLDTIDWSAKQLEGNLENINELVEDRLRMNRERDALLLRIREAIAKIKHLLSEAIVCCQMFSNRRQVELMEYLAHLVGHSMRRLCGGATAGFRWSVV